MARDCLQQHLKMIANSKFRRIARDLEKLPCELHENILADLEFHQLIRLSSCAGARLAWSLKNSHSPWNCFFRYGGEGELQKLLAITDKVKIFCFAVPKTKHDRPYIFEHGALSFLSYKSSQWKAPYTSISKSKRQDDKNLARHWLSTLNQLVLDTTLTIFHKDYACLVEPWAAEIPEAQKLFHHVPHLGKKYSYSETKHTKTLFAVDELAKFIELYQQVRLKRAEALAGELYRLADMYEAHATRLKMPFDPRLYTPEVFNATHIPTTMRRQARRIINLAKYTHWRRTDKYKHRFAWPALVPYDWCAQLFNVMVLKQGFLEEDTTKVSSGENQILAVTLKQECRHVVEKPPSWAVGVLASIASEAKTDADAVARLSNTMSRQHLGSQASHPPTICICVHQTTDLDKQLVFPRGDAELKWLEKFAKVTACLEQEYPNLLEHGLPSVSA